jgi:hypothetical protein
MPEMMGGYLDRVIPPQLMRAFYPRKYACPGGYPSPKIPARVFSMHCRPDLVDSVLRGRPLAGGVTANIFACGGVLASLGMPTYWVTRELALAASQTAPPESLKLEDIKFPLEGMLFMLPEGTLDPPGSRSSWLGVAKIGTKEGGVSVCFVSGGYGPTYNITLRSEEPIAASSSFTFETYEAAQSGDIMRVEQPTDETESIFTKRMSHFGTTLIMLMSARPELVTTDTTDDLPVSENGRAPRNKLFKPNWLGRGYYVARRGQPVGTHASPNMHWRRGHWRHQAHGPQRSQRKDIWIEPCLVNPETEETL